MQCFSNDMAKRPRFWNAKRVADDPWQQIVQKLCSIIWLIALMWTRRDIEHEQSSTNSVVFGYVVLNRVAQTFCGERGGGHRAHDRSRLLS